MSIWTFPRVFVEHMFKIMFWKKAKRANKFYSSRQTGERRPEVVWFNSKLRPPSHKLSVSCNTTSLPFPYKGKKTWSSAMVLGLYVEDTRFESQCDSPWSEASLFLSYKASLANLIRARVIKITSLPPLYILFYVRKFDSYLPMSAVYSGFLSPPRI